MSIRRDKVFGAGRPLPLDRNAKARVMTLARALMRRTEKGRAYGRVTAKAFAVLGALLYSFHNARSGLCFPSYESIAERAGCARSTVAEAIKALEAAGLLTWVNRLKRVAETGPGLFGQAPTGRIRVLRTSNGYRFNDPGASGAVIPTVPCKSDLRTRTINQDLISSISERRDVASGLEAALARLAASVSAAKKATV